MAHFYRSPRPRRVFYRHLQDGEDSFSLASEPVDHRESSCSGNSRLVEILREENATLKKELESYYNRVRKLQKVNRHADMLIISIWHSYSLHNIMAVLHVPSYRVLLMEYILWA